MTVTPRSGLTQNALKNGTSGAASVMTDALDDEDDRHPDSNSNSNDDQDDDSGSSDDDDDDDDDDDEYYSHINTIEDHHDASSKSSHQIEIEQERKRRSFRQQKNRALEDAVVTTLATSVTNRAIALEGEENETAAAVSASAAVAVSEKKSQNSPMIQERAPTMTAEVGTDSHNNLPRSKGSSASRPPLSILAASEEEVSMISGAFFGSCDPGDDDDGEDTDTDVFAGIVDAGLATDPLKMANIKQEQNVSAPMEGYHSPSSVAMSNQSSIEALVQQELNRLRMEQQHDILEQQRLERERQQQNQGTGSRTTATTASLMKGSLPASSKKILPVRDSSRARSCTTCDCVIL